MQHVLTWLFLARRLRELRTMPGRLFPAQSSGNELLAVLCRDFQSKEAQLACINCDDVGDYFQDSIGTTVCKACPLHTRRYIGKGSGSNRTSCMCKEGTWRHDGLAGRQCFLCPEGGICEGAQALPYPAKNYWAASVNQTLSISSLDPPGAETLAEGAPYFFSCPAGSCKGGREFECYPGHTGVQCSECKRGQFQLNGACGLLCDEIEPAGAHGLVATVFGIMAVMFVWVVLNKSAGGLFECLDVGISFMQIMSTVFTFSELYRGHSSHYMTIVDISNIINLNVDYVAPSCLLKDGVWRYTYGFYTLLIVPFIPFVISLLLYLLARLWAAHIKIRSIFGGLHLGFMCDQQDQARAYFLACLKESVPFLGVVYNNVCLMSFGVFSCQQLRDGTAVMMAAPEIVCWDSIEHSVMLGVSILALIVFVFGLPAFTFGATWYFHSKDKLRDLAVLETIGIFYKEYEPEFYCGTLCFFSEGSCCASVQWCSKAIALPKRESPLLSLQSHRFCSSLRRPTGTSGSTPLTAFAAL
jgi:hypothetical protein